MPVVYEFGPFQFDTARFGLLRNGEAVPVSPKAKDVLRVLLERSGQVVEKEDLMNLVWPDTAVEDANLTQTIFMLRKALDASRDHPSYIATVARRGYRFLPEVRALAPSTAADRPTPLESVAVLPFATLGMPPDEEYLGLGLADALITRLSNIANLQVRPTSTIRQSATLPPNIVAIGRLLRVDALVEGTIQHLAERIRVTVQLVDVRSGTPVWAERFEERFNDLFAVQDAMTQRIAASLVPRLTRADAVRLANRSTTNPAAHREYLKGRYHWNKRTGDGVRRSLDHFRTAIAIDPAYALAYLGIADCYVVLGHYGWWMPRQAASAARAAALRALELDETLATAHATLGTIYTAPDCDWDGAARAFRRAIELAPNDAKTRNWYANHLACLGRLDEAVSQATRAVDLDPLNLTWNMGIGHMLYLARRFEEAIEQERRTLDMDDRFAQAYWILGLCSEQIGRPADAVEALRRAADLSGGNPLLTGLFARACALAGHAREARAALATLLADNRSRYVAADAVGLTYAGLGDIDEAFDWLDVAAEHGCYSLTFLQVSPVFDPLRGHARFARLVRTLHLT